MRSKRLRLLAAAVAVSGCLACAHAEPTPEAAIAPAAQPSESPPVPEVALPAETLEQSGTKLSGKDDEAPKPTAAPAPTASPEVQAAFGQAMQSAVNGDTDAAIDTLQKALARDGSLEWAHFDLGALHERKGALDRALDEYKKALDVKPDFGAAAMAEARLRARQKRLPEAEADLRGRIAKNPGALGLRNALVFTLIQEGQLEPAATEAKKVLKSDEKNVDAMFQLASIYYKQGKNELALMVLNNAKAIRADDPELYNALGFVHIALGDKPTALSDFRQAAALSPDFVEAHNNLGALYNEAQDYPSAVKELERAVRDAPDFAAARLNLGNAYRGDKQYDKALVQYQKVLQLNPSYRDALFNLAVLYFDGDFPQLTPIARLDKANAYFDQYRAAGGSDPRIDQYKKDASKLIEKEKRREEREEKDKLRKAQKAAAEAKKDAAEAKKDAAEAKKDAAEAKKPAAAPTQPAAAPGDKLKDPDAPSAGVKAPLKSGDSGKVGGGDEK